MVLLAEQLPWERIDLLWDAVFFLSGAYAVLGNFALFVVMRERGSRFPIGGLAVLGYFAERRRLNSRWLDILAATTIIAVVLVVISASAVFPDAS